MLRAAIAALFLFCCFSFYGFIFGIALYLQRQRFQRVWSELIAACGDFFWRQPANFTDFIFLQGEGTVRDAAEQRALDTAIFIFEIELPVLGKGDTGNA